MLQIKSTLEIFLREIKGEQVKRDVRIDSMRAIAILLIMLAHVFPPKALSIPRMFDVPLMTFLMGMGMVISSFKKENYLSYVLKRAKRLLLPAFCSEP